MVLSLLEVVAECEERVLGLLEASLTRALIQSLLFLQLDGWLYLTRRRVSCDVEEIDIRLQISLLYI